MEEGKVRNFHDRSKDSMTIIPGIFVSCSTAQTTGTKYDPRRASMFVVVHFGRHTRSRSMRVYGRLADAAMDGMKTERTTRRKNGSAAGPRENERRAWSCVLLLFSLRSRR